MSPSTSRYPGGKTRRQSAAKRGVGVPLDKEWVSSRASETTSEAAACTHTNLVGGTAALL